MVEKDGDGKDLQLFKYLYICSPNYVFTFGCTEHALRKGKAAAIRHWDDVEHCHGVMVVLVAGKAADMRTIKSCNNLQHAQCS